jgi:NAD(P)H dehydrogenase (quinone)
MKTLIIYTHPTRESLNGAFLKAVQQGITSRASEHEVQVLDLYEEDFDPSLIYNQKIRRRDMHTNPDFEKYREQIRWADRLVFIYPIFWGRPPAMLLGFIDQVLATDFAYKYVPGKIYPKGLLAGKSAVCISTMKGPRGYIRFTLGNVHQVLMKKAVLRFVGIRHIKFFEFGSMESPKGNQARKLAIVHNYFAR